MKGLKDPGRSYPAAPKLLVSKVFRMTGNERCEKVKKRLPATQVFLAPTPRHIVQGKSSNRVTAFRNRYSESNHGIIISSVRSIRNKQGRGRPSEQAHPRSIEVRGTAGLDRSQVKWSRPCMGCDLLSIWPQGVLDVDLFNPAKSRKPCS